MTVPNLPTPQIGATGIAPNNSDRLIKLFLAGSEQAQQAALLAFKKQQQKDDEAYGRAQREYRLSQEPDTMLPPGSIPFAGAASAAPLNVGPQTPYAQGLRHTPDALVPEFIRQNEGAHAEDAFRRAIADAPPKFRHGLEVVHALDGQPAEVKKRVWRELVPGMNPDDMVSAVDFWKTGLVPADEAFKVFGLDRPDWFPTGRAPVDTPMDRAHARRVTDAQARIRNTRDAITEAERNIERERTRVENSLRVVKGVNLTPAQQAKADSTVTAFAAQRYPNLDRMRERLGTDREKFNALVGGTDATIQARPGVTVTPVVPKRKITKDQQAYLQSIGQWDATKYEVVP